MKNKQENFKIISDPHNAKSDANLNCIAFNYIAKTDLFSEIGSEIFSKCGVKMGYKLPFDTRKPFIYKGLFV